MSRAEPFRGLFKPSVLALVLLAGIDVLVVALFFGPALTGISLRAIPHFEELLPQIGLLLLWPSCVAALLAVFSTFRKEVLAVPIARAAYGVACGYVLLVSCIFGSIYLWGI